MISPSSVLFVVGNTYQQIHPANAKLDKTRRHRRVHDWVLYVDVLEGDVDTIDCVSFDMGSTFSPSVFTHRCPVQQPSGRLRFQSRQQTYGAINCEVTLRGRGGSSLKFRYNVRLSNYEEPNARRFVEARPQKQLGPVPLSNQRFGVELELTTPNSTTPQRVAQAMERGSGIRVSVMTDSYSEARQSHQHWKLMSDSSIQCHINNPDCNAVELVSPVLVGNDGLNAVNSLLRGLNSQLSNVKVNKSMGFHVHVNVSNITKKGLIKICQNFIKYEQAMDSILPVSRRDNSYCKSNRKSVPGSTNKERHLTLASCKTIPQVCAVMNPGQERYYKLNLENLRTGRQPTLEFRQHSATVNPTKVLNWIRFCVLLVQNSIRLRPPSPLREGRSPQEQLEMMFEYVVKDRYLRNYYRQRQTEMVDKNDEDGHCCDECATGGTCTAPARPIKRVRAKRY